MEKPIKLLDLGVILDYLEESIFHRACFFLCGICFCETLEVLSERITSPFRSAPRDSASARNGV